jgi:hypothetical protein
MIQLSCKRPSPFPLGFRSGAGVIQSWNTRTGWQAQRGWECPVIIDNMMNLEISF